MSISKLENIDTTLATEDVVVTGEAHPCHVGGGKLAMHVNVDGDYAAMSTTISLAYLADGATCPVGEECLGVDGGKAVYLVSVTTT